MKLTMLFLVLIASLSHGFETIENAYECDGVQAEYYDSSQSGIIRPINCTHCPEKIIKFDSSTKFKYKKTEITVQEFIQHSFKSRSAVIFTNVKTNSTTRISLD